MKATAIAPASIALIKYWGRKDDVLRLPTNGSISINASNLLTTTTVEFSPAYTRDSVIIDGQEKGDEAVRVIKHLDRIRSLAKIADRAKVVSLNGFPTSTGLSSSSSGFAALTVAAVAAAGLKLSEKELSILARQGSGSACRSIPDGFVEWLDGDTSESSYAVSLYPPEYWDIVDIVAIVSTKKKDVSSAEGHTGAATSPFYDLRQERLPKKIIALKEILKKKDFQSFGEMVEAEAVEFHAITMTSQPSLLYLIPDSLRLMKTVRQWRAEGLPVFFNINTGQDVHVICQKQDVKTVREKLQGLDFVREIIVNESAKGARVAQKHLF